MKRLLIILIISLVGLLGWYLGHIHAVNVEKALSASYNKGVESVCGPMREMNYNLAVIYCKVHAPID